MSENPARFYNLWNAIQDYEILGQAERSIVREEVNMFPDNTYRSLLIEELKTKKVRHDDFNYGIKKRKKNSQSSQFPEFPESK